MGRKGGGRTTWLFCFALLLVRMEVARSVCLVCATPGCFHRFSSCLPASNSNTQTCSIPAHNPRYGILHTYASCVHQAF